MNDDDYKDHEDHEDDQFGAFLRGEDALSQRLRALTPEEPPAQLDAAILARAAQAVQPEPERVAANDPAPPDWRPARARWRVPAGLAAILLAGVLTQRTWEQTGGLAHIDAAPAVPAPRLPTGEYEAPLAVPPSAQPEQPRASSAKAREQVVELDLSKGNSPPPMLPPVEVQMRAPAPAPMASAAAQRSAPLPPPPPPAMAVPAPAPAPAAAESAPPSQPAEAWLARIQALLENGADADALAEWDAFRAAHPDYPVDADTLAAINARRPR